LTTQKWVRDFCQKIAGELASDLYQELFLILCEKDDKWIEEKYTSGYWEGFIIRIGLNQFYGKRTNFQKNYLAPIGLYDIVEVEEITTFDSHYREMLHLAIEEVVESRDWYEQKIWTLYAEGDKTKDIKPRSARSISRATDISRQEILRVINTIKKEINARLISDFGDSIDEFDFC
jgi:hypothetical protein